MCGLRVSKSRGCCYSKGTVRAKTFVLSARHQPASRDPSVGCVFLTHRLLNCVCRMLRRRVAHLDQLYTVDVSRNQIPQWTLTKHLARWRRLYPARHPVLAEFEPATIAATSALCAWRRSGAYWRHAWGLQRVGQFRWARPMGW
jgi:hypothetical protein